MFIGTYEYCGIQRCGKSTMMVKDLVCKLLNQFAPQDIYTNFRIFIPGVNCMETMALVQAVFKMKADKLRHKVIIFDEAGQFLLARGYKDKDQTDFVSFAWQMPKRDIVMLYASNIGNSADVILRDATWLTIMPKYHHAPNRADDHIESAIIYNYDCVIAKNIITRGISPIQDLFDTFEPIE